eukprot:93896-Chlamydomonas_euryale.AAC.2
MRSQKCAWPRLPTAHHADCHPGVDLATCSNNGPAFSHALYDIRDSAQMGRSDLHQAFDRLNTIVNTRAPLRAHPATRCEPADERVHRGSWERADRRRCRRKL